MPDCTFYLISLPPSTKPAALVSKIGPQTPLVRGIPHGWVLQPQVGEAQPLVQQDWNLFLLTRSSDHVIDDALAGYGAKWIHGNASIPQAQYDQLVANVDAAATVSNGTPPLPQEWSDGTTGWIPQRHVLPAKQGARKPGELKLYEPMATYLSTTLPEPVRDEPVSLFNLFKYRNGDPSVHEHYMQGFKEKFGPAAGAELKFMGPVSSQPEVYGLDSSGASAMAWQDANLVQYDSIWHYAYMLSTDVYAELNKEKVEGLEDTCILLLSEVELEQ